LTQLTVEMIMKKNIITIPCDTTIEQAALIMQENRISALPVMEGKKLVGIITTTDVLEVLLRAIGVDEGSGRFIVLVKDRIGVVAEVSRLLMEQQISIRSLVTWPVKKFPGIYQLIMRVPFEDKAKAISVLTDGGFKILTEYVRDLTPYLPSQ
jgi:acetoin utilization protein AcuB